MEYLKEEMMEQQWVSMMAHKRVKTLEMRREKWWERM
jgi:hypothetical protein